MSHKKNNLDKLLKIISLRELKEQTVNWYGTLSPSDAHALTKHINTLEPAKHDFALGVIHTYTSDLLNPWLNFHAATQGINLHTYHSPYGMNLMESQLDSGLFAHKPDLILFLLTRGDLHPELAKPISGFNHKLQEKILDESIARLMDILMRFRENITGRIVLTLLPGIFPVALGCYDAQTSRSEDMWWASLKKEISSRLSLDIEDSMFLDLDKILIELGRAQFFDLRFWYSFRFPFTPLAANELSRRILNLATLSKYPKAKVIILDADNTLWGGVVGEDGINGIKLGLDYPGNTYMDFQRRLLDYQQRGFVLAICSKNNPADVQEVLNNHPHQILRDHHFVSKRINWLPKHENLISLANELNLGLDSFIFIDDSDHECAIVRSQLPQVQVIQTPAKPIEIPMCLEQVTRLEILSLTEEDIQKTQLYTQEFQRKSAQKKIETKGGDIGDYLASLEMRMSIHLNSKENIGRLAQLAQKTNQFNLTTRRYNEQQIRQLIESEEWTVSSFSLVDIFGDSGIVGMALFRYLSTSEVEIDTLLMSCRVIGRQAESAFLESMLAHMASRGVTKIVADYLPTPKNSLVATFYKDHSFLLGNDGLYRRNLISSPPDSSLFPAITTDIICDKYK